MKKKRQSLSYLVTTILIFWRRFKFGIETISGFSHKFQSKCDWVFLIIGAVNKHNKSDIKICKKSWSKYFETFWHFTKFLFHHKWHQAWILVIYMLLGSAKLLKTKDINKLENVRKISKLDGVIYNFI